MSISNIDRQSQPSLSAQQMADTLLSSNFLEAVPDAMVAVESDGTIVQINSQTEELFGYDREQLLGQKIEILVPERYRPGHHEHRESFAQAPKIRPMGAGLELHGRRRDGSEFPVEIMLSPVSIGNRSLVLSAVRDISDQKKIEEDLRRVNGELERRTAQEIGDYRARLAAIIDSSQDAIIGKTLEGIITSWNKAAENIYGYTSEEMVGEHISKLAPKDRIDEIPRILERIGKGESVQPFESIRVRKDGRRLDVSLSVSPLGQSNGKIVGASVIARDITAQKRAEDHLRQAQKLEAIGRLAGGVAHDFNNILGIVTACTELLRDRLDQNSEPFTYITNIRKAVDRGTALTRQLLAFGRKSAVQPQVLDLGDRLKDVIKLVRPLMGDDVEISIGRRSPASIVEVDPSQLDQIVLNLAVNSRDAMSEGGKFILETDTVQLDETFGETHKPLAPGKYVLLAVSDTGIGMDTTTVARIFEPFFTTKEVGKGTGLGLSTVYGIVQQHRGYIWVYSEPGRGTTFKIYLPCAEDKVGMGTTPKPEVILPRREGTTVLLVEDDELMLGLTRQTLEDHGYTVLPVSDGKSALETAQARSGSLDLVLTDIVMRGMSGPELVARLSTSNPGLRFVFMSGYTGELFSGHEIVDRGIPLLEKPFTRSTLLKTLDNALD
jgi:PAS domain S-box-containing protein